MLALTVYVCVLSDVFVYQRFMCVVLKLLFVSTVRFCFFVCFSTYCCDYQYLLVLHSYLLRVYS